MRVNTVIINNPNIDNSVKRVIGIPRDILIKQKMIETALKTHDDLSTEDRRYAMNIFLKNISGKSTEKVANFILQIYKLSNTGRFSFTYNLDLDTHIKAKIPERIKLLFDVSGTERAWPELYKNPYLTDEEKESIKTMSNREYYAILNTLENTLSFNQNNDDNLKEILPCEVSKDESLSLDEKGIHHTSIYSKCYDSVCISESNQSGKIISFSNNIAVPQIAYVADNKPDNNKSEDGKKPGNGKKHCFKLMELIEQLAKGNYINGQTGEMFSELALHQMLTKYEKEIKMYKRHLDIIN